MILGTLPTISTHAPFENENPPNARNHPLHQNSSSPHASRQQIYPRIASLSIPKVLKKPKTIQHKVYSHSPNENGLEATEMANFQCDQTTTNVSEQFNVKVKEVFSYDDQIISVKNEFNMSPLAKENASDSVTSVIAPNNITSLLVPKRDNESNISSSAFLVTDCEKQATKLKRPYQITMNLTCMHCSITMMVLTM